MRLPPQLAAVLFVAFIAWLFRRYSKKALGLSPGLWVPFLWVGILASRPVGYWLANGTAAAELSDLTEGSFIDRNVYLFLIVLGLGVLAQRRVDWKTVFAENRWLIIFYLYLLVSTVWSVESFVSFKRWFKDVGNVVMILIIITEKNPAEAMRAVFLRCAYVLIPVSVLFMKWYPDKGRYYHAWTWETLYSGVTTNKNSLGVLAMVSGLFLLSQVVKAREVPSDRRRLKDVAPDLIVLAMCLWILAKANSATALSCFMLGAVVFFGARLTWVRKNLRSLSWCALGVALVMVAFTALPGFRGAIAGLLGRDVTLTGRTDIWEAVLDADKSPLLGEGFASFWLTQKGWELSVDLKIPHAHNGYLETYLNSGWIGVCLLLTVLWIAGKNASRQLSTNSAVSHLFMALFLSGLLYNYTEVAFNDSNIVGFGLWLIAAWPRRAEKRLPVPSVQGRESPQMNLEPEPNRA